MKKYLEAGILLLLIFFPGCNSQKKELSFLESFGNNKNGFYTLIKKYEADSNRVKLDALYFLLTNIKYHNNDTDLVTADMIDKNITDAYKLSKESLRNKKVSFNNFCEYILPYRISNEPLEDWRQKITDEYWHIVDSLRRNNQSTVEITTYLNNLIRKGFKYETSRHPADKKNWSLLCQDKKGDCVEMTKTIIYPLRTFGIPSSVDYSICWANSNGYSHMWNALIYNDRTIPFMGMEANPDGIFKPFTLITNKDPDKTTYRLCGKVFRRTFSPNPDIPKDDIVFKEDKFFRDVTVQYFPVTNVAYSLRLTDSQDAASYVCNYTYGNWIPVFYGFKKQDSIVFANLANNILYLPVLFDKNQQMKQFDFPFVIFKDGKSLSLKPNFQTLQNIQVNTIQSVEEDQLRAIGRITDWESEEFTSTMKGIIEGPKRSKPTTGIKYSLYYWDTGWKLASVSVAKDNMLIFKNIPSNCLFKVVGPEKTGNERPFTYENSVQQWW